MPKLYLLYSAVTSFTLCLLLSLVASISKYAGLVISFTSIFSSHVCTFVIVQVQALVLELG